MSINVVEKQQKTYRDYYNKNNTLVKRVILLIKRNLPITFWLLVSDSVSSGVRRLASNVANPFSFRTLATYWFLGLSLPLPLP